ncbi:LytTR family transcriptional regulator DNA-binding domain-containing protein [Paenibacillus sp.]|uniref:LytTR family transcriptional regulator DNA-binding domain-containing protein n=1 Tax=Paenibacillus sp. TaxID=58172 RepID=UPI002D4BA7A6|nr:LytTR family transcriptional regulator DNA-binding domain-containing protein [Paenibacillus sp.]HZG55235.1 LytTR family transcriptional regulator DNA-binding domain-containing protein [Paenibacillus sp.]
MMMTVLKLRPDGSTELACISLLDVDYMEIEGRKIVYHIDQEKYRHISTLSELEEHLGQQGFDMLDKTNLVNLNRVVSFDDTQGKVYFQEPVTHHSKYATVALIKQKLIRREMLHSAASHIREILKRIKFNELKQRIAERIEAAGY